MFRSLPIPQRAGIGLRPTHFRDAIETQPSVGWFEVHAENFMGHGGPNHYVLEQISKDYPLSFHAVGMSIASHERPNAQHLNRLKELVDRYQPYFVSEHLAWSSHAGVCFNDLLPIPYAEETLKTVSDHIDEIQGALNRQILIENPATYVQFNESSLSEIHFLTQLANRTGCGLLLDINNVFVCAVNHGFDATSYIDSFPIDYVAEIHLAGHARDIDDQGNPLLIDSHDRAICDTVWTLYERVIRQGRPIPTLIERDKCLPELNELVAEARNADNILLASTQSRRPHAVAV